ncbi:helix-turn-helix domain-containing protein [Propionivibrio sp.]|uniref:helix-turn-helix domain-containing protein n=1 Tax=Propionivibrio sp. TaxID=2212460 RepID=UPI0039E4D1DE
MTPRFAMLPIEALADRRLTYRQLVVLGALCSFRDGADTWEVNPGRDALSERCGLHPSVISTATSELERLGWLRKDGKGGYSKATKYIIVIPETVAQPATVTESATVAQHVTVTESARGPRCALRNTQRVAEYATRKEERDHSEERDACVETGSLFRLEDEVPAGLDLDAWNRWLAYRKEIRKAIKPASVLAAQRQLAGFGADQAAVVEQSIANGWQGLFALKAEAQATGRARGASGPAVTIGAPAAIPPGATRTRGGIQERFTETMGWVPT